MILARYVMPSSLFPSPPLPSPPLPSPSFPSPSLPSPPLPSPPLPSSPQTSQDDMSAEDESVNRVSSMISTLLCEAATAPACERKVVSILATAVGQRHIDLDLVCKVEAGGICKVDTGSCL